MPEFTFGIGFCLNGKSGSGQHRTSTETIELIDNNCWPHNIHPTTTRQHQRNHCIEEIHRSGFAFFCSLCPAKEKRKLWSIDADVLLLLTITPPSPLVTRIHHESSNTTTKMLFTAAVVGPSSILVKDTDHGSSRDVPSFQRGASSF